MMDGCVEQQEEGSVLQDAGGKAYRLAENGATVPDGCRASCWCELRYHPQPVGPIVSLPGPLLEPFTRPWSCLLGGDLTAD
ncbi:uncharacterized [Tachysurus ichikawai]